MALGDADDGLRREAVHALAEIGGPAARRLLERAAADPAAAVRRAATELLAELAGPQPPSL